MARTVKKWLARQRRGEEGMTLLVVLLMMMVGSLLTIPTLNYVATSVRTGEVFEEKLEALYAAEAGVEDALWTMMDTDSRPSCFPHSYELTDVNGMTVNVVIEKVSQIAGIEIGESGGHSDFMELTKAPPVYDDITGTYSFTLSIANVGSGNITIQMILIDFPPALEYVTGSTAGAGDLVNGEYFSDEDMTIIGDSGTGITIIWKKEASSDSPKISSGTTYVHTFELSGPPDVPGVGGHGCVQAKRNDVDIVWDSQGCPYSITARAGNTTVRAGFWDEGGLVGSITCWQVNP